MTKLDLSSCCLNNAESLYLLKEILQKANAVKSLELQYNSIGSPSASASADEKVLMLIECLKSNNSIERLNIAGNAFSSENCALIFSEYILTVQLKELDCSNFKKGDENEMQNLKNALKMQKLPLKDLCMNSSLFYFEEVSEKYFNDFGAVLESFNELEKLSFNEYKLKLCSDSGFLVEFSAGLAICTKLQELELSNCRLCAKAQNSFFLGKALKSLQELTWLDLSGNAIGSSKSSVKFIMEALIQCKKLQNLFLYINKIGADEESASLFLDCLGKCSA